ncbi:MAG: 4Fe-4S binding protein [Actinobacteria bacterium]|nr:4Fe-4S binding protein [Actinomycetota bacterium]
MKESTRRLFRANGWRVDRAVHGYVYYRWIDYYIKTLMAIARRYIRVFPRGRFIFDFFFNRYHCKVLTPEQAAKLLTLDRDITVDPELSARVVPFPHAHRIILEQPQHIVAMDCACRIERSLCAGCGTCAQACPFAAVSLDGEGRAVVAFELCMGCGLCADRCEEGAPGLVQDKRKGIPLDIDELV